jgi:hypothetical protein
LKVCAIDWPSLNRRRDSFGIVAHIHQRLGERLRRSPAIAIPGDKAFKLVLRTNADGKGRPKLISHLPRPLCMSQRVPVVVVVAGVPDPCLVRNLPTSSDLVAQRHHG